MSALHEGNIENNTFIDPDEIYRLDRQIRSNTDNTDTFIREASFQAKQKLAPVSVVVVSGAAAFLAEKLNVPQSQNNPSTAALTTTAAARPSKIDTSGETIRLSLPLLKKSPSTTAINSHKIEELPKGGDIYQNVLPLEQSGKAAVHMPVTTSSAPERSLRADSIVVNMKSTKKSDMLMSYRLEEGQNTWSLVKHVEDNGTAAESFEAELAAALRDGGIDELAKKDHETVDAAAKHLPVGFREELLVQTNHTKTDSVTPAQPNTTPHHVTDGSGNSPVKAIRPKIESTATPTPAAANPPEASAATTPPAPESTAPTPAVTATPTAASPATPAEATPAPATAPNEAAPVAQSPVPTKSISEKPSTRDHKYDRDHKKRKHHKVHEYHHNKQHHADHTRSDLVHGLVVNHLIGTTPAQKIFNYFYLQRGLSKVDAAGIDGNSMQESHDNPDDEGGELFQWSYAPRFDGLVKFQENDPLHRGIDSLSLELDYAWCELKDCSYAGADEGSVLWYLRNRDHTVATAAVRFMGTASIGGNINGFENPGKPMQSNRIKYAEQAMSEFGKENRHYDLPPEKVIKLGHSKASKTAKNEPSNPTATSTTATKEHPVHKTRHHERHKSTHHEKHGGQNTLSSLLVGQLIVKDAYRYNNATYEEDYLGQNYGSVWDHWFHPRADGNYSSTAKVDCVGLAVNNVDWDLFDDNVDDSTWSLDPNPLYKEVSYKQVHPGDLIEPEQYGAKAWNHPGGHVEIVTGISGETIYTYGAHEIMQNQADDIGPAEYDEAQYPENMFLQYVGPHNLTPEGEKLLKEIKQPELANPVVHKLKTTPANGSTGSSSSPAHPIPTASAKVHKHHHKHHSSTSRHRSLLNIGGEAHRLRLTLSHKRKLGSHAVKHISSAPHRHSSTTLPHHSPVKWAHPGGRTLRLALGHKAAGHNGRK